MTKTELKIEHVDPGADGAPGGVRLTATVPWSEMNRRTMDRFVERRVAVPDDSTPRDEDDVYVTDNGPIDYDALLIVGAVPAIIATVARLCPFVVYGVLNGYAWEMEDQRNRLAKRDHRNRDEGLWLSAQLEAVSILLRELRFADLEADGYTRAELLKEERLIGGAEFAAERRARRAS